jgi:hypothetical protein
MFWVFVNVNASDEDMLLPCCHPCAATPALLYGRFRAVLAFKI